MFACTMTSPGIIPPLGLLYIAAALREHGYPVQVLDCIIEGFSETHPLTNDVSIRGLDIPKIIERIRQMPTTPYIVGISNLFSFAYPLVLELSKEIKLAFPETRIVLGGSHPSATPHETLQSEHVDFVIISEGEETVVSLLKELNTANGNYSQINGLGYKENGQVIVNPKTSYIENLDALPFPARDLIPMKKYYDAKESHGISRGKWTPLISSRGCPFECTFCTPRLWGRKYRARSPGNVLAEIEHCYNEYGIKDFHFEDENLTMNKPRLLKICHGLKNIDPTIKWQAPNGIRASGCDIELLQVMKDSGCEHVTVAPESGSPRVLNDIIRKRQNLDEVTKTVRYANKIGLKTLAYFMLGLPGETKKDCLATILYSIKLASVGLDEVGYSNFVPLPGSELYDKLKENGNLNIDSWFDLLSVADVSKSTSWSKHISDKQLKRFRTLGYISFHFCILFLRPLNTIKSLVNVITGKQNLKTERVLNSMIKRKFSLIIAKFRK